MATGVVDLIVLSGLRRPSGLRKLMRAPLALLAVAILTILPVVAVLAPVLAPADPNEINLIERLKPPASLPGGSARHLLETDSLGRDLLSRLIYGARISLMAPASRSRWASAPCCSGA